MPVDIWMLIAVMLFALSLNRDSERIPRCLSERSRDTEHRCSGVSERTENRFYFLSVKIPRYLPRGGFNYGLFCSRRLADWYCRQDMN